MQEQSYYDDKKMNLMKLHLLPQAISSKKSPVPKYTFSKEHPIIIIWKSQMNIYR
jgi:hypothetical protein